MKITYRHDITIRDLFAGYENDKETGRVRGFHGLLDIRPAYQREFVYKDKQQEAVINSVEHGFPLNTMYWVKRKSEADEEEAIVAADEILNDEDADNNEIEAIYEVLDGQQRTLSICAYLHDDFSRNFRYFHNLTDEEKEALLDYPLTIYICEGTDKEKLEWFEVINTAGEKLTPQELRNAVYAGSWLSDAKRYFSKVKGPAAQKADGFVNLKDVNRQGLLETALKWVSKGNIEDYMAKNQNKKNAKALWTEFCAIITWAETVFTVKRKEMKSVDWGYLYYKYKDVIDDENFDADEIEKKVKELMADEDVQKKTGIYGYVLGEPEKVLNIRQFDDRTKRTVYEQQNGKCANPKCAGGPDKVWDYEEMEGDHIVPWSKGGKTVIENCQMLCKKCNGSKSNK